MPSDLIEIDKTQAHYNAACTIILKYSVLMKKSAVLILSLIPIFFFLSCSNSEAPDISFHENGFQAPVVGGLRITTEYGPEEIGTWGVPSDSPIEYEHTPYGSLATRFYLDLPFPNPNAYEFNIYITVPDSRKIKIWIVKARFLDEKSDFLSTSNGATVFKCETVPIKVIKDGYLVPGKYSFIWDGKDESGNIVPSGFYRIYLSDGNKSYCRDVLCCLYEQIPLDIKKILSYSYGFK